MNKLEVSSGHARETLQLDTQAFSQKTNHLLATKEFVFCEGLEPKIHGGDGVVSPYRGRPYHSADPAAGELQQDFPHT